MIVCCPGWIGAKRLYLLMMGLDAPETCWGWRNILNCASSWFSFTQTPSSFAGNCTKIPRFWTFTIFPAPTEPNFIILTPVTVSENVFVKQWCTNPRQNNTHSENVQRYAAPNLQERYIFKHGCTVVCAIYNWVYNYHQHIYFLLFINIKLHSHMFPPKPASDQPLVEKNSPAILYEYKTNN